MYVPTHFRPPDVAAFAAEWMRREPFATLVSQHQGDTQGSHVPLVFDPRIGDHGALRGHLALPNPQAQHALAGVELLAIFHGPHAYISPSWYASPQLVPTWNYVAVHAYGRPRVLVGRELLLHLSELVEHYESGFAEPWTTDRITPDLLEKLSRAVVAFEVRIERIDAKAKLSQNRTPEDLRRAIEALRREGDPQSVAVGALMEEVCDRA